MQKKLKRFSNLDSNSNSFIVSAFLIAQFGKNDIPNKSNNISGDLLMRFVIEKLREVQHDIGGGLIYLECEEHPKLLSFYQNDNNRFKRFKERYSTEEQAKYVQLLKAF